MYAICGIRRLPDGHSGAASAEVVQEFIHVVSEANIAGYVAGKIKELAENNEETISDKIVAQITPMVIAAGSMTWKQVEPDEGFFILITKLGDQEIYTDISLREFEPQSLQSLIEDTASSSEE